MEKFKITLLALLALQILQGCGSKGGGKAPSTPNDNEVLIYGSPPTTGTGTDPLGSYQWHLLNAGNFPLSSNQGLASNDANTDLNFLSSITQDGTGVTVLVSDDTVEHFHDDLYANWSLGDSYNFLNDNFSGTPAAGLRSDDTHGTSVAGIIGAVKGNATGGYGIAHNVTLAGANTLSQAVTQTSSVLLTQADADVDIVNMSWGTTQDNYYDFISGYDSQIFASSTTRRSGRGTLFVKSAGNDFFLTKNSLTRFGNSNFDADNTLSPIINVSAITANGYAADYSSPGSNIWVAAPGGEDGLTYPGILTTDRLGCNYGYAHTLTNVSNPSTGQRFNRGIHSTIANLDCKYTSLFAGTSAAAPMVSGVLALLVEQRPTLSWREVKYLLAKTAFKVHAIASDRNNPSDLGVSTSPLPSGLKWEYGWRTNTAGFNFHNWYGFGSVDAHALLNYAGAIPVALQSTTQSTTNLSSASTQSITDNSASPTTYTLNTGSALTLEEVILTIDMTHTNLEEVMIEIESPSGMKNIVLNAYSTLRGETSMSAQRFRSNAFYGESASGNWKVNFYDVKNGGTGTVTNVNLELRGY